MRSPGFAQVSGAIRKGGGQKFCNRAKAVCSIRSMCAFEGIRGYLACIISTEICDPRSLRTHLLDFRTQNQNGKAERDPREDPRGRSCCLSKRLQGLSIRELVLPLVPSEAPVMVYLAPYPLFAFFWWEMGFPNSFIPKLLNQNLQFNNVPQVIYIYTRVSFSNLLSPRLYLCLDFLIARCKCVLNQKSLLSDSKLHLSHQLHCSDAGSGYK